MTNTTRQYVELSASMDTALAHMIVDKSQTSLGEILDDEAPLFTADEHTLHMAVGIDDASPAEALTEALNVYEFELDRLGVPDLQVNFPFEFKVVNTDLLVNNLRLNDDDPFDDPDEGLGVLVGAGGPLPSDGVCK